MADEFEIKRAVRSDARLRLAVCGASNGGKTWSSLEIAFGIVEEYMARGLLTGPIAGKVGLIDTERKSAMLYAHLGQFDTIQLGPPYSVERYTAAMQALIRAGCAVVILDGISPAWQGPGGLRALLSTFAAKDRFSAYDTAINPAQDEFVDMMLRSPCHLIATMRSKTEWVLEEKTSKNGNSYTAPRRIGMAPIQRPGIEYEFTTMFDVDTTTHYATILKNRCTLFEGWQPKKLTREHGRQLASWLLEAAPEENQPLTGTPLERATAIYAAAVRACERAATVPDLAAAWSRGDKDLKAFKDSVSEAELRPLVTGLITVKDARKAALGGDRNSGAPALPTDLDPDIVMALEQLLVQANVGRGKFLAAADVPSIRALSIEQLPVMVNQIFTWADQDALELRLPVALTSRGIRPPTKSHFHDMPDDIPF